MKKENIKMIRFGWTKYSHDFGDSRTVTRVHLGFILLQASPSSESLMSAQALRPQALSLRLSGVEIINLRPEAVVSDR